MVNTQAQCIERTNWLFSKIYTSFLQTNKIYTCNYTDGWGSFRVYWANSDYAISIAVPAGLNMYTEDQWIYETALWSNANDTVVYNNDFNYEDVLRFDTTENVIAEIERVFNITQYASVC
jgi:hypothetical protein